MTAAWSMNLQPTEKLVMLALADFANDDGHCWPAHQKIVDKCGVGDRQVRRIISKFETDGHLQSKNRGRRSNYYILSINNKPDTGDRLSQPKETLTGHIEHVKPDTGVRSINEPPENRQKPLPTPSESPARKKEKKNTAHSWFVNWWCYTFAQIIGSKYAMTSKDGKQVKQLLQQLQPGDLLLRACAYIDQPESKRFPRGSPTLGGLLHQINEVADISDDTIDKFITAGLLPEDSQPLRSFQPWKG